MTSNSARLSLLIAATVFFSSELPITASAQTVSFDANQDFAVGTNPRSVAVGDFNGDGVNDLAVANCGGNTVSVLLGNGDGTFQEALTFVSGPGAAGGCPDSVAVGDVNGDGKPDLAVANAGSGCVGVLLGNGDGTFQAAQCAQALWGGNYSVALGDFNGDLKPDLAVNHAESASIGVVLGNGDGTFQSEQTYAVGDRPQSVAVGDFNGDGKPDLAVAIAGGFGYGVSVLLGNGDGTFQAAQSFAAGKPYSVAVGDFNGDGRLDLAVANALLLGNGDGTFQTALTFGAGSNPYSVAVGDFNGDGRPDLAVANLGDGGTGGNPGSVSVLVGNGDGTFQTAQTFAEGDGPVLAVGDLNGDGKPDLAVANSGSNTVSVLINNTAYATNSLTVTKTGIGSGTVTSSESPAKIDCGATCSASYESGTMVTLTAMPASGSIFIGWSGCDTASGTSCTVAMSAARSVTATFDLQRFTLTVTKTGIIGGGTVTSSPTGIDCGAASSSCSANFISGTTVTLTATPAFGSLFTGWSGCDAVSGTTCTVAMSTARSVTASFLGIPPLF